MRWAAAILCASVSLSASAQTPADMPRNPDANPAPAAQATARTGPGVIWISDGNGNIGTINPKTFKVTYLGNCGLAVTDIAFHPGNHKLYAITFSALYSIDTGTARATYIGSLNPADMNALLIDKSGEAFSAGYQTPGLYSINLKTGAATLIGKSGSTLSAGDFAFYNGALVLATESETLVKINPKTGKQSGSRQIGIANLFGLASTSPGTLYGFANTSLYQLFPNAGALAGRSKLLVNFQNEGFNTITGAAYDGNFQN